MAESVVLSGISYEIDEPRKIGECDELRQDPELLRNLSSLGLVSYSPTDRSPVDLAIECAERTLWKSGIPAADVDLLLYATTTFERKDFYSRDIRRLRAKLGLERAFPMGITLSECANMLVALDVASKFITTESARRALVITVDKVVEGESRIVPPQISVASDAAASLMVMGEGNGQFRLLGTAEHAVAGKSEAPFQENFTQYLKISAEGTQRVCQKLFEGLGKSPAEVDWLITNNYNQSVASFYSNQSGIDLDRVYCDNISRFGHAFGADNPINLADCVEDHPMGPGALYMLLAAGPSMWATGMLEKC